MSTAIDYEVGDLLRRMGAVPPRYGRGKWTCPKCQRTTLSVLEADEDAQHKMTDRIVLLGGVPTYDGRFVELDDPPVPRTLANG